MVNCKVILRVCVIITLVIVYVCYFGIPTITEYYKKDTIQVTSTKRFEEGIRFPGITICSSSNRRKWKTSSHVFDILDIENVCKNNQDVEDIGQCVRNGTFNLTEVINKVEHYHFRNRDPEVVSLTYWTSSMTLSSLGMCHSLSYPRLVRHNETLVIWLTPGPKKHKLFIHDPTFFEQKSNNYFIPHKLLDQPEFKTYGIVPTQHVVLNSPPKTVCNEDPSYDFTHCIRSSVVSSTGCQVPWDNVTNTVLDPCNNTNQLYKYGRTYYNFWMADEKETVSLTGCLLPCQYTEYSVIMTPDYFQTNNVTYVAFKMATMDMKYSKEILVFPLIILVGQIGGGLGLFLGFSYPACFDKSISLVVNQVKKHLNKESGDNEKSDEQPLDQETDCSGEFSVEMKEDTLKPRQSLETLV